MIGRPPVPDATKGSIEMLVVHEDLARARMRQRRAEAAAQALASRVAAARRWQRRAETATRRARAAREALG